MKRIGVIGFLYAVLLPLCASAGVGQKLLIFWRSDCAPCMEEIRRLPVVATQHPHLSIILMALRKEAPDALHGLPENVTVQPMDGSAANLLRVYGDPEASLPFSVMMNAGGHLCKRRYGVLGTDIIDAWVKQC